MSAVREKWTDERLDDLSTRVDEGFRESREETRLLRIEIRADIASMRTDMDSRFDAMNARFDAMQRLMIAALLTIVLGFIVDRI